MLNPVRPPLWRHPPTIHVTWHPSIAAAAKVLRKKNPSSICPPSWSACKAAALLRAAKSSERTRTAAYWRTAATTCLKMTTCCWPKKQTLTAAASRWSTILTERPLFSESATASHASGRTKSAGSLSSSSGRLCFWTLFGHLSTQHVSFFRHSTDGHVPVPEKGWRFCYPYANNRQWDQLVWIRK